MSDITSIDHKVLAESRLATEFSESVNLINYLKSLLLEANTLEEVYLDLLNKRWIDTAVGAQLDIIGAIVGQPRILVDATALFYFGFDGALGSNSFGTLTDSDIGGRFRSIDEATAGNRELTDDEYRLFIRARIVKNSIFPTVNEMIEFFKFLFDAPQVIIIDNQNMTYSVQIGKVLDANEKQFLLTTNLIPKVAAVGVQYYANYESGEAFAFSGVPSAKGLGTLTDSTVGGKFASLI